MDNLLLLGSRLFFNFATMQYMVHYTPEKNIENNHGFLPHVS